jgi:hypothetical protein
MSRQLGREGSGEYSLLIALNQDRNVVEFLADTVGTSKKAVQFGDDTTLLGDWRQWKVYFG